MLTDPRKWYVAIRSTPDESIIHACMINHASPHWLYYGRIYDFMSLWSFIEKGQDEEARSLMKEMRQRATTRAEEAKISFTSGYAYAHQSRFDRSIACLDEALRLNPKYGEAFCIRGSVFGVLGDYGRAITDLTKAIQLEPELVDSAGLNLLEAYRCRGKTRYDRGNWNKARADFSAAITRSDRSPLFFLSRNGPSLQTRRRPGRGRFDCCDLARSQEPSCVLQPRSG